MKLDAKTVAALKLDGQKDVIHFDSSMSGFGYRLRLGSGGKVLRSWIVQYRRAGATRRMLLGSAEVLGAEAARTAAKKVLAKVALGEDPAHERTARRTADKFTLAAMVDEFLAVKKGTVRRRTFSEVERYLRGGYFKPLHAMPADQVRRADVASRILVINRENGATTATRARSALSELFAWGVGQGLVEYNPIIGTNRPKTPKPRDRVLSSEELVAIWRATDTEGDFDRIVRLLMLLGQRRTEVGGLAWSELNLEGPSPTWTIPSRRTKNARAHTLPLPPTALDIIKSVPRSVNRDNLFGQRSGAGFTAWGRGKRALDRKLGDQVASWSLHDQRRSFCTHLADLGTLPHAIEAAVNHFSGFRAGHSGTYNRSPYAAEIKAALLRWDSHLQQLISGDERKVVVAFPGRE